MVRVDGRTHEGIRKERENQNRGEKEKVKKDRGIMDTSLFCILVLPNGSIKLFQLYQQSYFSCLSQEKLLHQ